MKRTVYLFIIIISIFAFAILGREFVNKNNQTCNDTRQKALLKYKHEYNLPVMDSNHADLMGGIVVDACEGFEHRFFYVGIYNKCVTVFNMYGSICFETGITIYSVESDMRKWLSKGIYFDSIHDARNFIESIRK